MRTFITPCLALLLAVSFARADYTREVAPVLTKHCVSCHGPDKQRASLRLDSARGILQGGSSGPAVVPGKSGDSLLLHAIEGIKDARPMPPKGPRLTADEVAVLKRWIDAGAKAPANETVGTAKRSSHWAFQPIVRHPEPSVKDSTRVRNSIDRFILARLEKDRIAPSPEADKITLLRRVSLDLTGTPPSREETEAFLADTRPDAYERVVDRLLSSARYGERWGRHWLDQARYADSNGYSIDSARAIWKYRDWVINALNADLPFDQFTIEQLAGDLLPKATLEQKVATGFHRNTQINEEGGIDLEQFRVEAVVDRTNTTGAVWLGLTVACAQCHDHKYDPISQKEYYQLYAFFNNSDDPKLSLQSADLERQRKTILAEASRLEKNLFAIDHLTMDAQDRWEGGLSVADRKKLPQAIQTILAIAPNGRTTKQLDAIRNSYRNYDKVRHIVGALANPMAAAAQMHLLSTRVQLEKRITTAQKKAPASLTTMVLNERKMPRPAFVQLGGDFLRKGATVKADVPAVLPSIQAFQVPNRGTRLDLGRWLVDGNNPLTGRVMVNRVWQVYFGVGLVETENDFGTQGLRPSHPELLDWLADEFVRRGWSMKQLHRLIVTSATYRQSSNARPDLRVIDPRNLLLARQNRLRLEAEVVRDAALTASGLLAPVVGGPSVFPPQPAGVYGLTQVPKNWIVSLGLDRYRRGMYTYFWRSAPHPGLTVFDAPDASAVCTRRNRSNTPLQALTLLNDEAFFECARQFAARVLKESPAESRLDHAFELAVARRPNERERQILTRVLERQRAVLANDREEMQALVLDTGLQSVPLVEQAAWVQLSRVLLNLDEFITRE